MLYNFNYSLINVVTIEYNMRLSSLSKYNYNITRISNLDFEEPLQNIPYVYPISGWRDQLLSYNDESFEYDNLGNPTKYRDKVLQWSHGRQLDKFTDVATYTYNANGIRTKKIVNLANCGCNNVADEENVKCDECDNTFSISYYLNGNKIIKQHDCCNDLTFYYGAEGITGFHITSENATYNEQSLDHDFYYKKNLQGDIIGIIDSNGEEIVEYVYDAWGNHKAYNVKTGELLDISSIESYTNISNIVQFIAIKNPFRYRGYYYDFETGLYYLNSRYYDPETGRFINADDISNLSRHEMNGLNLYAYCVNNPVNLADTCGHAWWHWLVGALAVALAAVAVVITAGGAAAGIAAVAAVAAGGAAMTMGATISSAVFIGAVTTFAAMSIIAGIDSIGTLSSGGSFSDALNTFADYGESAMWSTFAGGVLGGIIGYSQYKSLNSFSGTHTPSKSTPFSTYKNTKAQTITHYNKHGNMWWSKHLTNHNYPNHSAPHWHLEMPHRGPYNNLFEFIIEFIKNLKK